MIYIIIETQTKARGPFLPESPGTQKKAGDSGFGIPGSQGSEAKSTHKCPNLSFLGAHGQRKPTPKKDEKERRKTKERLKEVIYL